MRRSATLLLGVIAPFALIACDPIVGVHREARIRQLPNPERVGALLRRVPGVDSAKYYHMGDGTTGWQTFGFAYWGPLVRAELNFRRDSSVMWLEHTSMRIGDSESQAETEATSRLMREIEARLDSLPELAGFRERVEQRCVRVRCS